MLKMSLLPIAVLVGNPRAFETVNRAECLHVQADASSCYGVGIERDGVNTSVHRLCEHCAREFALRMHSQRVQCDYCLRFWPKDQVVQWMPLTAIPSRGDQPQVVCQHCVTTSASLQEDYAHDRKEFLTRSFRQEGLCG